MTKITLQEYLERIDTLIDESRLGEAINHCRHILEQYPRHVETYRLLGKALLELGKYKDSADIFQRVLSADPEDFIAHVGLSIVYKEAGELKRALWHMERAFEIDPYNAAIQQELKDMYGQRDGLAPERLSLTRGALARLHVKGELYQQAVSELNALLAEDKGRVDLETLLAEALWRDHQRVDAVGVCLNVLKRLPFCIKANAILAEVWLTSGRMDEAQEYLKRVQSLTLVDRSALRDDTPVVHAFRAEGAASLAETMLVDSLVEEAALLSDQREEADWVHDLDFDHTDEGLGDSFDWLDALEGSETEQPLAGAILGAVEDEGEEEASGQGTISEDPFLEGMDWFEDDEPEESAVVSGGQEPPDWFSTFDFGETDEAEVQAEEILTTGEQSWEEWEDVSPEGQFPEWLVDPEEEPTKTAGTKDTMPDWLQMEGEADEATEALPEWLQMEEMPGDEAATEWWSAEESVEEGGLKGQEATEPITDWWQEEGPLEDENESSTQEAESTRDWLRAETAFEEDESSWEVPPEDKVPDWLRGDEELALGGEQDVGEGIPQWLQVESDLQLEEDLTSNWAAALEDGSKPEERPMGLMDEHEMDQEEVPAGEKRPENTETPQGTVSEDNLDWLQELEEAGTPGSSTVNMGDNQTADDLPDWLLEDLEVAPGLDEAIDWLKETDEEKPAALPPEDPADDWLAGEGEELVGAASVAPEEEDLSWLDQIASGVGAAIEEGPTMKWPEGEGGAEESDWPGEITAETAGEEEGTVGVLPGTSDETASEVVEDVPEDLEEAMAWLEQLAAHQGAPLEELPSLNVLEQGMIEGLPGEVDSEMPENVNEALDWLEQLAAEQESSSQETSAQETSAIAEEGQVTPVDQTEDALDWLAGGMVTDEDSDLVAESDMDWLSGLDSEEELVTERPTAEAELDWLSGTEAGDNSGVAEMAGSTPEEAEQELDWLAGMELEDGAGYTDGVADEDEELDWLAELGVDEAPAFETGEAEELVTPPEMAEETRWLSGEESDSGGRTQAETQAELEAEEGLDWLNDVEIDLEETDVNQLLTDLAAEAGDEELDWLSDLITGEATEGTVSALESSSEETGEAPEDLDEAMAWLEQLAARQGAPLDELPSVQQADVEPAEGPEVTASAKEEEVLEDEWMTDLLEPDALTDEEDVEPLVAAAALEALESGMELEQLFNQLPEAMVDDVPEDLDEVTAWLEQLAAQQEASLDELPSVQQVAEDVIPAGEPLAAETEEGVTLESWSVLEPEADAPEDDLDWLQDLEAEVAPEVAVSTEPASEQTETPEATSSLPTAEDAELEEESDEVPEDLDEAMAWLERLAAQQGAPLDELPSIQQTETPEALEPEAEPAESADDLSWLNAETDELEWMQEPDMAEETVEAVSEAEETELTEEPEQMPEAVEMDDEVPEDLEEAMAWLEKLAAQQTAPLDELPSVQQPSSSMLEDDQVEDDLSWLEEVAVEVEGESALEEPAAPVVETTVEEPVQEVSEKAPAEVSDLIPEDIDEAMAWLERLAAQQGAPLDELPSIKERPEGKWSPAEALSNLSEEIPDDPDAAMSWLESLISKEEPAAQEPVTPVEEPPTPPTPQDVVAARAEAEAMRTQVERVEEESLELPAAETVGIEDLTADEAEMWADPPEDPDEAMAWLERLAARQGAALDELPTVETVEDEVDMPAWLAREVAESAAEELSVPEAEVTEAGLEMAEAPVPASEAAPEAEEEEAVPTEAAVEEEMAPTAEELEEESGGFEEMEEDEFFKDLDLELDDSLPDWLSMEMGGEPGASFDWEVETDVTGWLVAEEEITSQPSMSTRLDERRRKTGPLEEDEPARWQAPPELEPVPAGSGLEKDQIKQARQALRTGDFAIAQETYEALVQAGEGLSLVISDLESASMTYTDRPAFRRLLGDAYMKNGQLQKALNAYREALDSL